FRSSQPQAGGGSRRPVTENVRGRSQPPCPRGGRRPDPTCGGGRRKAAGGFSLCSVPKKKDLQSVCGQPVFSSRIIGGQDAAIRRWPWQVSLHLDRAPICGGSLISKNWILTAAHCLPKTSAYSYSVWLGSLKADASNKGKVYYVSRIVIHPKYDGSNADIALLRLSSQVTFSADILPICLPSTSKQLKIPASCWVTGWGLVKENAGDNYPHTLQEAEVPVFTRQECEQLYNPIGGFLPALESVIKEDMICAGDIINKKDSCKGDSGGPLSCHIGGIWIQIGVVSWGVQCGQRLPGVYTSVIYYQQWINDTASRAAVLGANDPDSFDFLFPMILLSLALLGPFWAFGPNIPGE
ncbi:PREDICTED: serine protease 48, partial [Dipodomys ordii]|uniref:Serine protease 48 n=1 Tax=Dipodomys ordii TaxID=10020 RepID=A0A1S3G8Z7_DIPOR